MHASSFANVMCLPNASCCGFRSTLDFLPFVGSESRLPDFESVVLASFIKRSSSASDKRNRDFDFVRTQGSTAVHRVFPEWDAVAAH